MVNAIDSRSSSNIVGSSVYSVSCRICHVSKHQEGLLSPCNCKGSVSSVHLSCLEKWLNLTGSTTCELCQFQFRVKRKQKTFINWLKEPASIKDKRNLAFDSITFVVLTALSFASARVCILGASYYLTRSIEEDQALFRASGLIFLTVTLSIVYICWMTITMRYHFRTWRQWKKQNFEMKIIMPSSNLSTTSNSTDITDYCWAANSINNNEPKICSSYIDGSRFQSKILFSLENESVPETIV